MGFDIPSIAEGRLSTERKEKRKKTKLENGSHRIQKPSHVLQRGRGVKKREEIPIVEAMKKRG